MPTGVLSDILDPYINLEKKPSNMQPSGQNLDFLVLTHQTKKIDQKLSFTPRRLYRLEKFDFRAVSRLNRRFLKFYLALCWFFIENPAGT